MVDDDVKTLQASFASHREEEEEDTVWKNEEFTFTEKIFRETNNLVT